MGLVSPVGSGTDSTVIPFPSFCSDAHGGSILSVPGMPASYFKQIKVFPSETQKAGWLRLEAQQGLHHTPSLGQAPSLG